MQWVRADLARMEELPPAFGGGDHLFLLTGSHEDMVWLQKNAIQAAREAGIRRLAVAACQRGGGATERVTDTVERLTGAPPRTLRWFAEDHADQPRP